MPIKLNTMQEPIRSPELEELIIKELHKRRPLYSFMYRCIRETGIELSHLTHLTAADLKMKDLTFRSHAGVPRTMPLSEELHQDLLKYLADYPDNALVFTGKSGKHPLHPETVATALRSVSKTLGINPPLSVTAIRLTFVYHLILSDGNCTRAREFIHASTAEEVYARLSLLPEETPEYLEGKYPNPKEALLRYDIAEKIRTRIRDVTDGIEKSRTLPEYLTDSYSQQALSLLEKIDTAITSFEKATQNPD